MFTNPTRWLTSRRAPRGNLTLACVCAGRRTVDLRWDYTQPVKQVSGHLASSVTPSRGNTMTECTGVMIMVSGFTQCSNTTPRSSGVHFCMMETTEQYHDG